jgi:hypothetical protein
MRQVLQKSVAWAGVAALCASLSFAAAPQKSASPQKSTSQKSSTSSKSKHHSSKKSRKPKGQQAIDSERCREIQEALVREHYMSGQPSGKWDDSTQQAMRRYQADQGWQNKSVPDSRALIRLGLGPDHEHLLNPETAMTTQPRLPAGRAARPATTASSGISGSQSGGAGAVGMSGSSTSASPVSAGPEVSPQR